MDSTATFARKQTRTSPTTRRWKLRRSFPIIIGTSSPSPASPPSARALTAITRLFTRFEPLGSELYGELAIEEFSTLDATMQSFRRPWT
jgi:hypothetical protein